MSRNYKFHNPDGLYFVPFADVKWLKVFTRAEYKEILIERLKFCQSNKGMAIFAWCIRPNHIHLVFRCAGENKPGNVLGDFKRFTGKKMMSAILSNPHETRKAYFLKQFELAGNKSSNVKSYQFYRHVNHLIKLRSNRIIKQKIDYDPYNPVKADLVYISEDYPYRNAIDDNSEQGSIPLISILRSDFLFGNRSIAPRG